MQSSRRDFVRKSAAAGFGLSIVPRYVLGGAGYTPPSGKLNVAMVGTGGQGMQNLRNLLQEDDVHITAIADVAESQDYSKFYHRVPGGRGPGLQRIREKYQGSEATRSYPETRVYVDFRVMLDTEKEIDAVVVSTPDHTHTVAVLAAIGKGKHVYCEKPLARTIKEVRTITEAARKAGVTTQMGHQGHGGDGIRLTREWIQDGAVGPVREVHVWSADVSSGGCAGELTSGGPVPEGFDWNLWIGPVEHKPYHPDYTPCGWRQYWHFGTGKLGDMACHNMDPAFYALDLGYPEWVQARCAWGNRDKRLLLPLFSISSPRGAACPP